MGMVVRIFRYARQHVEQAEKLKDDLIDIRKKLNIKVERVEDIYTGALTKGDRYVPVCFMKSDYDFNRYRVRMEEVQNQVVMNLALSLSFCAELVSSMVHVDESEALGYKVRVRNIIDRVIAVATDEAMNRASLAPLASAIAKIESDIILYDADKLTLIRRHLLDFRARIS